MEKGTLVTTSLSKSGDFKSIKNKLFVVSSCKNEESLRKDGWEVARELAPSKSLFYKFLELREMKQWNRETFESIYRPEFVRQMKKDKDMIASLAVIKYILDQGEDVLLGCYCVDFNLCHRSLLSEYFEKLGYRVVKF